MISEKKFAEVAKELDCEVEAIKAVAQVESKGEESLPTGEPIILFEPHIFYRELKKVGLNPDKLMEKNSDIIYPKWGTKPYGKMSEQHTKLNKAVLIHREAALKSCSWGMFQIMGFNYQSCGFETLQEFINSMYGGAEGQLDAFAGFIKYNKLDKHIRNKDWAAFAKGYNGSGYAKNQYDIKLKKAYESFKK